MSDTVTNVEIEDVLSSIRRLVSVDSARGPRPAVREIRSAPPDAKGATDRLVLTADLRVVEADGGAADGPTPSTMTLEKRIAELEAAVNAQPGEFEPDGSEDTTQHRPTAILGRTTAASLEVAEARADPVEAEETADAPESGEAEAIDETADAHPTIQDTPQDAWADDDDADGAVDLDALIADYASDAASAAFSDDPLANEDPVSNDGPQIAAALPRETNADTPFDNVEVFDAERFRTRDAGESGVHLDGDDAVIDEETLRDMVAEIVRQELQGALGERITRNVRKLVRREIMRAISIRDFE